MKNGVERPKAVGAIVVGWKESGSDIPAHLQVLWPGAGDRHICQSSTIRVTTHPCSQGPRGNLGVPPFTRA